MKWVWVGLVLASLVATAGQELPKAVSSPIAQLPPASAIKLSCLPQSDEALGCFDFTGSAFSVEEETLGFCGNVTATANPCSSKNHLVGSCVLFLGKPKEYIWRFYHYSDTYTAKEDTLSAKIQCLGEEEAHWFPNN